MYSLAMYSLAMKAHRSICMFKTRKALGIPPKVTVTIVEKPSADT